MVHLQKKTAYTVVKTPADATEWYYKEATKLPSAKTTRGRRHEITSKHRQKRFFSAFFSSWLCLEYLGSIVRESASGYEAFDSIGKEVIKGAMS